MAQLVIAAAGAALGAATFGAAPLLFGLTGAQIGWTVGALIGAQFGPTQKSEGPRLGDLKVSGTEYGQPIPYIQGHPRVAGQLVWASARREIATTTEAGKGGPSAEFTSYTYEVDVLYLLSDNEQAGFARVWNNGDLVFTQLSGSPGDSLLNSINTSLWRRITFYSGAASQLPDPTYEAAVGAGNAPAYRGRATIFIEGLQLGSSGQIPNLTFEIASSVAVVGGAGTSFVAGTLSNDYRKLGTLYVDANSWVIHERVYVNDVPGTGTAVNVLRKGRGISFTENVRSYNIERIGAFPIRNTTCSDDAVLVVDTNILNDYQIFRASGVDTRISMPVGGTPMFAVTASAVFAAPSTAIYRFTSAGVQTHVSSTLASLPVMLAADANYVYVVLSTTNNIVKLSAADLSAVDTFAPPANVGNAAYLSINEAGDLFFTGTNTLYRRDGSTWTTINTALGIAAPGAPITAAGELGVFVRGTTYYHWQSNGTSVDGTVEVATLTTTPLNETLQNVVSRLCLRAGMQAGQFDVTSLSSITKPVRALAVSQVGGTRATLEMLAAAYFFEAVLSDKLYFRPRGGASVATLPYADLGASTSPQGDPEPLTLRLSNELEMPGDIAVTYSNVDSDYNADTQTSDRLISSQTSTSTVQLALGLTASEAKGIADAMLLDQLASLMTTKIALLQAYARLEPTDVIVATAVDGSTFRLRAVKINQAAGVRSIDCVLDDASALSSAGITSSAYASSTVVAGAPDTQLQLLDAPILRDADNQAGFYLAVKGSATPYPGAAAYRSLDAITYERVVNFGDQTVIGTCTTTLGNWTGGNVVDEGNTVTVDVGLGTLASVTHAQMVDASANACMIGSEVLQFKTATFISTGIYRLGGLLRGRRGTQWAMTGHVASERFVLLQTSGLRRLEISTSEIGALRYYRGVTLGRTVSTAQDQAFTCNAVGLKPFAPVDLRAIKDSYGLQFTWSRCTRLATSFSTGTVPLGEASESYDVELLDSGNVVVKSATVSSPSWSSNGLTYVGPLVSPAWGLDLVSGELVGVRDDALGIYTTSKYVQRFSTAGASNGISPTVGQEVYQFCRNGDQLYVATAEFNAGPPVSYRNGKVQRIVRTSITTVAATYTAASPGDPAGVAHDGTDLWVSERYAGRLNKLNSTTLASVATYAVTVGMTALVHVSGDLWICSTTTNEIVKWNIATTAETLRFSVVSTPSDVLVVGSLVFVQGVGGYGVYNATTGAQVALISGVPYNGVPQRGMCVFGSYVVMMNVAGTNELIFVNSSTGAEAFRITSPWTTLVYVSGSANSLLWLSGKNSSGDSLQTRSYNLGPADLAGYKLRVYQKSATVGRGYVAQLSL